MKEKYWFRAKYYGWGWYPWSWQGWLIMLIWAILFVLAIVMMDHEWLKNVVIILIITAGLIWVCYLKGEKPRWRWGKK